MALIFLDLDGTLVDPKPGITGAIRFALQELGLHAPSADELEWAIGPALVDTFAKLGTPEAALALYRQYYTGKTLFDARVYDGILDVLDSLSAAGHRLFLATAKPHAYAKKITAHFGLDKHMELQFGPELDGTRNDKGELLAYALSGLKESAAHAVMIGDRSNDLNAARANQMTFIGVDWGYAIGDELASADAICSDPLGLPELINRLKRID